MGRHHPLPRWDLILPVSALVVLGLSLGLALTAARALQDRHRLAVEGRLSLLAHSLERDLRETPPSQALHVLSASLAQDGEIVLGLALDSESADLAVGVPGAGPARRFDLFLGPLWRAWRPDGPGGPSRRGGGHRQLEVTLDPEALRPPVISRLLVPGAAVGGLLLLALAALGGRLLRRQQEEQRREGESRRLEGLSRAGAGLAHQLRTPLATIKGSCQLLLEGAAAADPESASRRLSSILQQCERMDRLLTDLLDYARPPQPEAVDLPLADAFAEVSELAHRVRADETSALSVRVDPEHLRHILTNLVSNALESSAEDQPVEVTAREKGEKVEICIADRGPGAGPDPEHLFEPYVTTRAAGTGLGLPLARSLAAANDGTLTLEPRPGGGTCAVVRLPRARKSEEASR